MNLITKLLMENETTVITLPSTCAFYVSGERTDIVVVVPKCVYDVDTKKDLLSEVPEQYYVSTFEWMLLKYWQENGAQAICVDEDSDVRINVVNPIEEEYFYQAWSKQKLFKFLETGKEYKLDDLINHCALIEG